MNLTEQLAELSCAEDFFDLLEVDYEPEVILNKRVPLLRLFNQALADFEAPEMQDYQAALRKAYCLLKHGVRAEFAASKCATCASECN
jgi:hypothetical protein